MATKILFSIAVLFFVGIIIQEIYNKKWREVNTDLIERQMAKLKGHTLNYKGYALHHNILVIGMWMSIIIGFLSLFF